MQESGHSSYSTYSSGSRSSHRSGKHRSRRRRDREEEEEIYTEIRRPRLEAVTEASVEATPVTWRRPQLVSEEILRQRLRCDKRDGASDINDVGVSEGGRVNSDDVTRDNLVTPRDPGEELLALASSGKYWPLIGPQS